jgi:putative ABC transport system permease protein
MRLALTESMVLALAGGVAGIVVAWVSVRLLVVRAQTTIPRLGEVSVDASVLLFTILVSVATGILFGLLPASRVARTPLALALRDGARGQSEGRERRRSRTTLIVLEVALAVLLVIAAGLTIRSFRNLLEIDPGFDARSTLTLRLTLPASEYPTAEGVAAFYQDLRQQVRSFPGVSQAGFVRLLPLATEIGDAGMVIDGKPTPAGQPGRSADWQAVTPGYFEAMGIRLVRGRFFDATDTPDGLPVIAINETLAREYFPGEDPIGQRIRVGGQTRPFRTIIAVVGDVHHNGMTTPVKRAWFVPHNQWTLSYDNPRRAMTLVLRSTGDPLQLVQPVEQVVHRLNPNLTLSQIRTLEAVLASATREQRFTMALMAGFALLALALAAVGIYGVVSYSVSLRTREIGIRLALGADAAGVRTLVLSQGMVPVLLGLAGGLIAAMLLTRHLGALLYGIAPLDPITFTTIPLLMLVVAACSVLIPASRASRVQPVEALRSE